jgi:hypothetical protein
MTIVERIVNINTSGHISCHRTIFLKSRSMTSFVHLLPSDVMTYLMSFLNIQELSRLDSSVTSTGTGAREYLYYAFKNLILTPNYFSKSNKEVLIFERISVYVDTVFSHLAKGPFIYENRYTWLQNRQIKVKKL